jgi:hypothetical protein
MVYEVEQVAGRLGFQMMLLSVAHGVNVWLFSRKVGRAMRANQRELPLAAFRRLSRWLYTIMLGSGMTKPCRVPTRWLKKLFLHLDCCTHGIHCTGENA